MLRARKRGQLVFEEVDIPARPGRLTGRDWPSVTQATIGSTLWSLELRPMAANADWRGELATLASHSGGVNLFFEPPFQEAAIGRIGAPDRMIMLVHEHIGDTARLRMALPVAEERRGLPPVRMLRAFSHPFAPLSAPLIDLRETEDTTSRFAELFAQLTPRLALVLEDCPLEDAGSRLLIEAFKARGMAASLLDQRQRAVVAHNAPAISDSPAKGSPIIGSKETARKNVRFLKRLRELGDARFETTGSYLETMMRFEEFLVLEARGWKGRKGGAIIAMKKTAPFARQAVSELAKMERARIHTLRLDGRAIASLVMLRSANRYYPWKIAVDDAYRAFSPGIILSVDALGEVAQRPDFEMADTLTSEGSWIERIVHGRMEMATVVFAADERTALNARLALSRLSRVRRIGKRLLGRGGSRPARLGGGQARGKSGG
jgi:CelD/BcsL family acetyltransferase involved in cellulose biosynthesis